MQGSCEEREQTELEKLSSGQYCWKNKEEGIIRSWEDWKRTKPCPATTRVEHLIFIPSVREASDMLWRRGGMVRLAS